MSPPRNLASRAGAGPEKLDEFGDLAAEGGKVCVRDLAAAEVDDAGEVQLALDGAEPRHLPAPHTRSARPCYRRRAKGRLTDASTNHKKVMAQSPAWPATASSF